MTAKKLVIIYGLVLMVVSLPFVAIHLMANPGDASITAVQRTTAVIANFFGPWGVAIVRLVDFPNAGLRSFSWLLAIALTILAAMLVFVPLYIKRPYIRYSCVVTWSVVMVVWFGVGLRQIADGLL